MRKKHANILYAEDDFEDQEMFRELLEHIDLQLQPLFFENGVFLMQHLESLDDEQLPNGIVLDVNMPMWDGTKTLETIRKNPRYRSIPVIIFTTSSEETEHKYCLELGATAFLTKPMNHNELRTLAKQLAGYLKAIK